MLTKFHNFDGGHKILKDFWKSKTCLLKTVFRKFERFLAVLASKFSKLFIVPSKICLKLFFF